MTIMGPASLAGSNQVRFPGLQTVLSFSQLLNSRLTSFWNYWKANFIATDPITGYMYTHSPDDDQVATISGASNASPIVITCTGHHGRATGHTVTIAGVKGNTAANGTWTITKISDTQFSLNTSVGNGAYTSGGTVTITSTTTEGNGYSMLMAYFMGDTTTFTSLYNYIFSNTRMNYPQTNPDLPIIQWKWDVTNNAPWDNSTNANTGNAADGDTDIAWACILMGESLNNSTYIQSGLAVAQALYRTCRMSRWGRYWMGTGGSAYTADHSQIGFDFAYFNPAAFRKFSQYDVYNSAGWLKMITDGYYLATQATQAINPLQIHVNMSGVSATNSGGFSMAALSGTGIPNPQGLDYEGSRWSWLTAMDWAINANASAQTYWNSFNYIRNYALTHLNLDSTNFPSGFDGSGNVLAPNMHNTACAAVAASWIINNGAGNETSNLFTRIIDGSWNNVATNKGTWAEYPTFAHGAPNNSTNYFNAAQIGLMVAAFVKATSTNPVSGSWNNPVAIQNITGYALDLRPGTNYNSISGGTNYSQINDQNINNIQAMTASVTAASPTVTAASADFAAGDVGKFVTTKGGQVGTISLFTDPTHVNCSANFGTTENNVNFIKASAQYNVHQSTAAAQPTVSSNALNGLPAFVFDGTDDEAHNLGGSICTLLSNVNGFAVAFALKTIAGNTGNQQIFQATFSNGGTQCIIYVNSSGVYTMQLRRLHSDASATTFTNSSIFDDHAAHIYLVTIDYITGNVRLYRDGICIIEGITSNGTGLPGTSGNSETGTGTVFRIGNDGGSNWLGADMGIFTLFTGTGNGLNGLTVAQMSAIEYALNTTIGYAFYT